MYFREMSGLKDITLPDFAGETLDPGDFAALQRVTFTGVAPPALRQPGHLKLPHPHGEVVWATDATPSI